MPADPRKTYVDIATRRFAADGFHGASLAALARDAQVSKQALLHFFGTKERLYRAVLDALCLRLCAEIDATRDPDPRAHLTAYYHHVVHGALTASQDVRLVIRALLDSDPNAQVWPLKPYLDQLIDLTRALPGAAHLSRPEALAQAYRFIGSVQYIAISLPTIQGIYGPTKRDALTQAIRDSVAEEVARIAGPA